MTAEETAETATLRLIKESKEEAAEMTAEEEASGEIAPQHAYDYIESFVKAVEKHPEASEIVEREMGEDEFQGVKDLTKFSDFIKTAYAKLSGTPLTEEELSKFREQEKSFKKLFNKERFIKWIAKDSPEERERIAKNIRKMFGDRHSEATESVLRDLKVVDTEEPEKEKA